LAAKEIQEDLTLVLRYLSSAVSQIKRRPRRGYAFVNFVLCVTRWGSTQWAFNGVASTKILGGPKCLILGE